jgi:hypothetical protein
MLLARCTAIISAALIPTWSSLAVAAHIEVHSAAEAAFDVALIRRFGGQFRRPSSGRADRRPLGFISCNMLHRYLSHTTLAAMAAPSSAPSNSL